MQKKERVRVRIPNGIKIQFYFFKKSLVFLAAFISLSLIPNHLRAVPPFGVDFSTSQVTCFVNVDAVKNRLAAQSKFAPGFAAPISAKTYNIAVLRIDFSDKIMTQTQSAASSLITSLRDFYLENSYNYLTINPTISNSGSGGQSAFRMPQTHSYYAAGLSSKYSELTRDAIAVATTAGFSFSSYDHIMVLHAGAGAETAQSAGLSANNFIWSVYVSNGFVNGPTVSGKTFSGVTFVPESEQSTVSSLGVICHEYGHQLGLPDLYNTANNSVPTIGQWSLMDYGIYIGSPQGSNPSHLDAWSKQYLGFSSPETLTFTLSTSKTLGQSETNRSAFLRLPIGVSDVGGTNEYYLVEYRRTSGATYDTSIPGQGILIWHIDDSIASNASRLSANTVNTNTSRLGVELIEADSSDSSLSPYGDSTDPWSSSTFGSPKSKAYNGVDSSVEIGNFAGVGGTAMSMILKNPLNNPAITSNSGSGSAVVTGGENGYVNPNKGENALFGVRALSSGRVEIKVYSLTGTLVWETSYNATANEQVITRWDGKNADAATLGSGIYIVHIKGAGVDSKKKIAIIK